MPEGAIYLQLPYISYVKLLPYGKSGKSIAIGQNYEIVYDILYNCSEARCKCSGYKFLNPHMKQNFVTHVTFVRTFLIIPLKRYIALTIPYVHIKALPKTHILC